MVVYEEGRSSAELWSNCAGFLQILQHCVKLRSHAGTGTCCGICWSAMTSLRPCDNYRPRMWLMCPGSPLRQRWQTRSGPGLRKGWKPGLSCSVCGGWLVKFEPLHVSIGHSSTSSAPMHTRLDLQKSHGSKSRLLFFWSFTHCIFTGEVWETANEANGYWS